MDLVRPIPRIMSTEQNRRLTQVVNDAGRRMWRFIRSRVRSDADAEDVLQDVWQQLAVTLDAGPVEQVSAWLYRVARNRIIDRARRPAMDSLDALDEAAVEAGFDFGAYGLGLRDEHTPRAEHKRRLFWETLHAALAELPEEQRQVFVWHELEAMSFQDMAELTGEKVSTLLSRKRYAVLHLRARLEPLRADFLTSSA